MTNIDSPTLSDLYQMVELGQYAEVEQILSFGYQICDQEEDREFCNFKINLLYSEVEMRMGKIDSSLNCLEDLSGELLKLKNQSVY